MSHFVVGIIHHEEQDIEDLLTPYDCEKEVERYIDYTKEELIEKGKKEIENYKNSNYKEYLEDPKAYKETRCIKDDNEHINYLENEFPKMLKWSDEEIYKNQLKYYKEEDIGEDGNVYSNYNPDSRWDWYQIGGRWSGLLKLKPGATTGKLGDRSWTNKDLDIPKDRADIAQIKDIDFSVSEDSYKKLIRFWELKVEGQEPQNEEEKEMVESSHLNKEFYKDRYKTKEEYAKCASSFSTFAVITPDAEWHEKGEMGWWGLSSENHEDAFNWEKDWYDVFIKNTDEELYLTIVDCHI